MRQTAVSGSILKLDCWLSVTIAENRDDYKLVIVEFRYTWTFPSTKMNIPAKRNQLTDKIGFKKVNAIIINRVFSVNTKAKIE